LATTSPRAGRYERLFFPPLWPACACWAAVMLCATRALGQPVAQPQSDARPAATSTPAVSDTQAPVAAPTADGAQLNAIARALFDEGLAFVDSGDWLQAADRFSRLLAVRYSAVAAYNFGLAQARLGKLVTAAETLRRLLADAALDDTVRQSAVSLQAEVQRELGSLTVRVAPDAHGCMLYVDGQVWPVAAWGVAVPVNPGQHSLSLRLGRATLRSVAIEVAAGAHVEHLLSLRAVPGPAAAPASSSVPAGDARAPSAALAVGDPHASRGGLLRRPWFWVGVGAVLAAAVTTGVVLAASQDPEPAKAVKGDFLPGVIEGRVP